MKEWSPALTGLLMAAGVIHAQQIQITQQPQTSRVSSGAGAEFFVDFTGPPDATVQWMVDGKPVPGETQRTFSFPHVLETSGRITAQISAPGQLPVTSNPVSIEIQSFSWGVSQHAASASWSFGASNPGAFVVDASPMCAKHAINYKGTSATNGRVSRFGFSKQDGLSSIAIDEQGVHFAGIAIDEPGVHFAPGMVLKLAPDDRPKRFGIGDTSPAAPISSIAIDEPGVHRSLAIESWSWGVSQAGSTRRVSAPAACVRLADGNDCDDLDFALEITQGTTPPEDPDGAFFEMECFGNTNEKTGVSLGILQVGTKSKEDVYVWKLRCDVSYATPGSTQTCRLYLAGGLTQELTLTRNAAIAFEAWPCRWKAPELNAQSSDFALGWPSPVTIYIDGQTYQADCLCLTGRPVGQPSSDRVIRGAVFRGSHLDSVIIDDVRASITNSPSSSAKNKVEHWGDPHENLNGITMTLCPPTRDLDCDGDDDCDGAELTPSQPYMLSGIGSSGNDGVSIKPGFGALTDCVVLSCPVIKEMSGAPQGVSPSITMACRGTKNGVANQPVGSLTISKATPQLWNFSPDFSELSAPTFHCIFYGANGEVLADHPSLGSGVVRLGAWPDQFIRSTEATECVAIRFSAPTTVMTGTLAVPNVRWVQALANSPPAVTVGGKSEVIFTAANLDRICVSDEYIGCRTCVMNGIWTTVTGQTPGGSPTIDFHDARIAKCAIRYPWRTAFDAVYSVASRMVPPQITSPTAADVLPFESFSISVSDVTAASSSAPMVLGARLRGSLDGAAESPLSLCTVTESTDAGVTSRVLRADFSSVGTASMRILARNVLKTFFQSGEIPTQQFSAILPALPSELCSPPGDGSPLSTASLCLRFSSPGPVIVNGVSYVCDELILQPVFSASGGPPPGIAKTIFAVLMQNSRQCTCMDGYFVTNAVVSPRDAASGLATGRRQHKPLVVLNDGGTPCPTFVSLPRLTSISGFPPGSSLRHLTTADVDRDGLQDDPLHFLSPQGFGGVEISLGECLHSVVSLKKGSNRRMINADAKLTVRMRGQYPGSPEGSDEDLGELQLSAASEPSDPPGIDSTPACRYTAKAGKTGSTKRLIIMDGSLVVHSVADWTGALVCNCWPDTFGSLGGESEGFVCVCPCPSTFTVSDSVGGGVTVTGDQVRVVFIEGIRPIRVELKRMMSITWSHLAGLSIGPEYFMPISPRFSFGASQGGSHLSCTWMSETAYMETSSDLLNWKIAPVSQPDARRASMANFSSTPKSYLRVVDDGVAPIPSATQ